MRERVSKEKVIKVTHSGELLIWLLIVLIVVAISSSTYILKTKHEDNDYRIYLQDVDGLIVGSPVRMMGVEVGHVTKIKPLKDDIYVKFILTNPDVYIPQGTHVTVEFSGMAGSKSLELYLPNNGDYIDNLTPLISPEPPKRLHDSLALLNDMFKKLGSIIYTTSDFGAKLKEKEITTKQIKKSTNNMDNFINYSNKFLDDSNQKALEMRTSLKELKK